MGSDSRPCNALRGGERNRAAAEAPTRPARDAPRSIQNFVPEYSGPFRNNRNVRLVRTPRSTARIARCQPPSAVAWRTVDLICRATPEVVGPGSQGAIPTTRLVIVLGGTGVDSIICGHLPKFVARRVRSRLPPPPLRRADARTPGSVVRQNEFFRGFQAIVSSFGRRAGEASRA